jgi:hypothetical protein
MKLTTTVAAACGLWLAFSALAQGQPAAPNPANVCLNTRDIQRTETPSDRTILFHMRDGKIWRNTLRTNCPMLRISPFTQVLHTDMVCANQQIIHIALTGNSCVLGDFTPAPPQR